MQRSLAVPADGQSGHDSSIRAVSGFEGGVCCSQSVSQSALVGECSARQPAPFALRAPSRLVWSGLCGTAVLMRVDAAECHLPTVRFSTMYLSSSSGINNHSLLFPCSSPPALCRQPQPQPHILDIPPCGEEWRRGKAGWEVEVEGVAPVRE